MNDRGNRSMPAETGVWVVKMVPALTVSMAVAASRCCSWIRRRMRSRPRTPAETLGAGRDRGVGGEDGPGPDRLDGGGRVQVLLLDQAADALQAEEPGMALVGVEHLGLDTEGAQGPDPADAEQDLLAQAVLAAAPAQGGG